MQKFLAAAAGALLIAGCATQQAEQECIPWSGECEPDTSDLQWEVTTYYEGDREPETETHKAGADADTLAERACSVVPTPWMPERPTRVEVTDINSGDTSTTKCEPREH